MAAEEAVSAGSSSPIDASRRFKLLALGILLLYALVIARGDGEFWPFSKFPMFARAGRPWTRALVVELAAPVPDQSLVEVWENELPGPVFPLHRHKINQDDLSAVLRAITPPVNAEQAAFLAKYFERVRHDKTLVLYSVRGSFRPDRSVRVRFNPLAIIGPDGVRALLPQPVAGDAGVPGDASSGIQDAAAPSIADAGSLEAGASGDAGSP
jgi:hypothetical protein